MNLCSVVCQNKGILKFWARRKYCMIYNISVNCIVVDNRGHTVDYLHISCSLPLCPTYKLFNAPMKCMFALHKLSEWRKIISLYTYCLNGLVCIRKTQFVLRDIGTELLNVILVIVFINNQQMNLLTVLLLHSTAPTCFDARALSSGNFSVPAELL
jgi:hypothetical protein